MGYSILVIWKDGQQEFLKDGFGDEPAVFHSKARAARMVDFMREGMEDEVQSINFVASAAAVGVRGQGLHTARLSKMGG